jgi:hypothetical protein
MLTGHISTAVLLVQVCFKPESSFSSAFLMVGSFGSKVGISGEKNHVYRIGEEMPKKKEQIT